MNRSIFTQKPVDGFTLAGEAALLMLGALFLMSLALTFTTVIPDYPLGMTIATGVLTVVAVWSRFFMKD